MNDFRNNSIPIWCISQKLDIRCGLFVADHLTYERSFTNQDSLHLFCLLLIANAFSLLVGFRSYEKRIIITAFAAFSTTALFQKLAHWEEIIRDSDMIEVVLQTNGPQDDGSCLTCFFEVD